MSLDPKPAQQTHITTPEATFLGEELEKLATIAYDLSQRSIETSSRKTYTSYQRGYIAFFTRNKLAPFDVGTVMLHVADRVRAGEAHATLRARIAAISRLAKESKQPDPTKEPQLRDILRNAGREIAKTRSVQRVEPLTKELLGQILAVTDAYENEWLRLRDRALILFAFATGRRGSEIADIRVADITTKEHGWLVRFRWSKTNKTGEPEYVGIPNFSGDPLNPIDAIQAYLSHAHIGAGHIFRTRSRFRGQEGNPMRRQDIARRIEKIAATAGLLGRWRSHSFRRGLVTSAEQAGVARSRTRLNTGWKSDAMFATYAQHDDVIAQSPLHEIFGARQPNPLPLEPPT